MFEEEETDMPRVVSFIATAAILKRRDATSHVISHLLPTKGDELCGVLRF